MICAGVSSGVIVPVSQQGPDMSTCAVVLVTGGEAAAVTSLINPSPADFAAAWGWGFSLVLGTFLVSWGAGSVLRMFGR